jgi:hypothetical protein
MKKNMKKCNRCNIEKEETEFAWKNKINNKLHPFCKECKKFGDREAYNQNTHGRKEKIRQRARDEQQRVYEFYRRVKEKQKCAKCGDSRWYVMDFHHIKNKKYEIGALARQGSIKKLKDELRKCIPLCANCHREHHYNENLNKNNN